MRYARLGFLLAVGLLGTWPVGAAAQQATAGNSTATGAAKLDPGTWVRVTLPRARLQGEVATLEDGVLTVRTVQGAARPVPVGEIRRLEVREAEGRRQTKRGLAIGFGVGALGGAVAGLAMGNEQDCWFFCSAGEKALLLGSLFGSLGGGVGAGIGYFTRGPDWREIPPPGPAVRLGVAPAGRGVALAASVRF